MTIQWLGFSPMSVVQPKAKKKKKKKRGKKTGSGDLQHNLNKIKTFAAYKVAVPNKISEIDVCLKQLQEQLSEYEKRRDYALAGKEYKPPSKPKGKPASSKGGAKSPQSNGDVKVPSSKNEVDPDAPKTELVESDEPV